MNINAGDYVTLKSLKDVMKLYDDCELIMFGCGKSLIADNTDFSQEMVDALGASKVYKVERAEEDDFVIIINGNSYWFDKKCIKSVYKLVRVGTNCKYLRKVI